MEGGGWGWGEELEDSAAHQEKGEEDEEAKGKG